MRATRVLIALFALPILGCPQFTATEEPSYASAPPAAAPEAPPAPTERPAPPAPPPRVPDAPIPVPDRPQGHTAVEMLSCRHVLVAYRGALRADPAITRSKEEARARAEQVVAKLRQGADFAQVANEYTDDASGRGTGGRLPPFNRSSGFHPAFVEASYGLAPGAVSGIVETPFGFHIIRREP